MVGDFGEIEEITMFLRVELHFGSKKTLKISLVFEDLSRNSVFFRTEVNERGCM